MLMPGSEKTVEELGIGRHPPSQDIDEWEHYKTLASPPPAHPLSDQWASSIYRGLVPAKNVMKRDFAINGAFVSNSIFDKYLNILSMLRMPQWIVRYEQRIWMGGDCALDIVVLP